jgi:ATP-grasp ribosomal peptide maturase
LSPAPADDRPVVVLTGIDDPTADMVIRHLNAAAVPVVRLDPADFPREVSLSARIGTGRAWSGRIDTGSRQFDPGSVRALWLRRPGRYAFPGMDAATAAYATAQAEAGLGGVLRALPGCLYVNHPAAHQAASVKPVQLDTAARAGFDIPDTLITSDPAVAREFTETHDAVIHKPLGPSLWHPDGDRVFLVGVSDVNAAGLDETVGATAHLFQARIPKTHDVRLTVIGNRMVPIVIDAGGVLDWRTTYGKNGYRELRDMPGDVEQAVKASMAELDLVFAAFDFAVDGDGHWWFLEANAAGQFAWLEEPTGCPLTAMMAEFLRSSP